MYARNTLLSLIILALIFPVSDAHALKSRRRSAKPVQAPAAAPAQTTPATPLDTTYLTRGEVGGYAGYMLAGELEVIRGDLIFVNGLNYGGQINFRMNPLVMLELGYNRIDTQVDFKPYLGAKTKLFDAAINHFQIGALAEFKPLSRFKPYGLFTVGMAWFDPKVDTFEGVAVDDAWRMSIAMGLGFKVFLHPRVGLRAQTRLIMPLYFDGGGIFCGTGGCGGGLTAGVIMAQGDFTGGAFVTF